MKKIIYSFSILIIPLLISACESNTEGIEGQWNNFNYSYNGANFGKKEKIIQTETKVMVVNSSYHNYKGRTQLIVYWRAINTGKDPNNYGWANKAVMDEQGRIYKPYEGTESGMIQPMDETSTIRIAYDISTSVKVNELVWGLYHDDAEEGLKYKIKLNPKSE